MFCMSASLSVAAMPVMMALARLPDLNSCNCLIRYSGCCWSSLGWTGITELPSGAWQAAHTTAKLASPLARSGLTALAGPALACGAAGLASCAKVEKAGTVRAAANNREASSFIGGFESGEGQERLDSTM